MYSRLIHTVDHVEGRLRPEFDALDAFLAHTWAVTVTGAPKAWAMQFIEDHERSPRAWYGGAVGLLGFDGNLNTGPHAAHDPRQGRRRRRCAPARRCSTTPIPTPRRRRRSSRRRRFSTPSGARAACARRGAGASRRAAGRGQARPARRPPGLVRPHAGQLSAPDRRRGDDLRAGFPRERARRARGPTWWCSRRAPARRATSTCRARSHALLRARHPGLRRLPRAAGHGRALRRRARRARLPDARQASRIQRAAAGALFDGLPQRVHAPAATTRSSRCATQLPADARA